MAELAPLPIDAHVLEVEHHIQLLARRIGEQLRLVDGHAGHLADVQKLVAPLEDLAIHLLHEFVDARAVGEKREAVTEPALSLMDDPVLEREDFRDQVDDIHAKSVDAAIDPPVHHLVHSMADLRVLPVQVRLAL